VTSKSIEGGKERERKGEGERGRDRYIYRERERARKREREREREMGKRRKIEECVSEGEKFKGGRLLGKAKEN
jgi:hypothetical protein